MKPARVEAPPAPPLGEFHILAGGILLLLSVALHGSVTGATPLVYALLFVFILAGLATWQTTLLAETEKVQPLLPPVRLPPEGRFRFSLGGLLLAVVTLFFAAGFAILPLAFEYSAFTREMQRSAVVTAFCFGMIGLGGWGWYEFRRKRRPEGYASWAGAGMLLVLSGTECTEPRWLTTAFAAIVFTGGLLAHRRWLLWAHEVIARHQAQAQSDGDAA